MYICTVHTYVHMYCMYLCTYVLYTLMYICTVRTYVHMYCTYLCTYVLYILMYKCTVHTYVHIYCTYFCTYMCTYICTCIHASLDHDCLTCVVSISTEKTDKQIDATCLFLNVLFYSKAINYYMNFALIAQLGKNGLPEKASPLTNYFRFKIMLLNKMNLFKFEFLGR
jgi:hypothetical protein